MAIPDFYKFQEYDKIKENLCLLLFDTILRLGGEHVVSFKEILPEMHITRERLQRILNCIERNEIYFRTVKGYMLEVSNIVASIERSRRFRYKGKPCVHFKVTTKKPMEKIELVKRHFEDLIPYDDPRYEEKLQNLAESYVNNYHDVEFDAICELHDEMLERGEIEY